MVKLKYFVFLILIFGNKTSVGALGLLPMPATQVRENRHFETELEPVERTHVHLTRAKLFVKHIFFSIKFALKKLRTAYRFLKPEMKMGSCLTHYYNINPFGLRRRRRRRRRRNLPVQRLSPTVADRLLRISDSLADIQQALADIIHELHMTIPVTQGVVPPDVPNSGPTPTKVLNASETPSNFGNVVSVPTNLLDRVDHLPNSHNKVHLTASENFLARVFMFLFKKTPTEAVELWKSAKNRSLWGWVKLIVGKIIKNKLLICSREYMGTRLWDWVDYGLRKL